MNEEKMNPTHRMYLCRMLKMKNLSEELLERYAQVKRLVDRIDGHLTPGDLAMIIVSLANNPEIATELLDESDDKVIEEAVESPKEAPTMTKPVAMLGVGGRQSVGPLDETGDKIIEEAVESPVSGVTGQAAEKPTPKDNSRLWSPDMPVKVLQDDEIKQGKIFAVHPGYDSNDLTRLTVALDDGETVTVNEDIVEAV